MYLVTCTRLDLGFSLSYLSRFFSHPLERHYTAVTRVIHYLPVTHSMSRKYQRPPTSVPLTMVAFSNPECATYRDTNSSVSRYAIM